MPTTRSGPGVSAPIAVTGSEEVLLARIASGPQASASAGEQLPLQVEVLGRGLDHQVAAGQPGDVGDRLEAPARLLGLLGAPHLAPDALAERLDDPLRARLQRRRVGVLDQRLVAAEAGELGDPRAHRPGADDADPLDGHRSAAGGGSSPSQKGASSRS